MQVIRPSPGVKILRLLQCHVCHVPRDHGKVYHRTDIRTAHPPTHTHTPTQDTDTHCVCMYVCLSVWSFWSVVCCSSGPSIRLARCPCSLPPSPNKNRRYFWKHTWLRCARSLFCFAFGPLLCLSPSSPLGPSDEALVTRSSCTHRGGLTPPHHTPPPNPPRPECLLSGAPFGCYGPIQGRLVLGGLRDRCVWPHLSLRGWVGNLAWDAPQKRHSRWRS